MGGGLLFVYILLVYLSCLFSLLDFTFYLFCLWIFPSVLPVFTLHMQCLYHLYTKPGTNSNVNIAIVFCYFGQEKKKKNNYNFILKLEKS